MVDIAMCQRSDCPKNKMCYRYTAKPAERLQTYLIPEAIGDECDMFWPNAGYRYEEIGHVRII